MDSARCMELGVRVLVNVMELQLDSPQLLRIVAYKVRSWRSQRVLN